MTTRDEPKPTAPSDDVPPGMPSWVKYLLGALLVVVLLTVLAMIFVGGDHGPGRHGAGMHSAPAMDPSAQRAGR